MAVTWKAGLLDCIDSGGRRPALGDHERHRREIEAGLRRVDRLARLLDEAITVPGVGWRFGLDGLIGLVPGVGDAAGALLSGYVVKLAGDLGCRRATVARMAGIASLDFALGLVPVLGDVADFFFKANSRNVKLMRADLECQRRELDRRASRVPTAKVRVG